ncbi:unnamed protein product [Adineta steineri]|uniref:F-box domain-containing protein n=2 Tax=Adineta steineri TaxID=433720 RepID=A0A818VJY7_9BILA|nr:unnamed protein product [Adineta steineri]
MMDDFIVLKLNSSFAEEINHHVSCFLDLTDEIILRICRYLSPAYVLNSFYIPDKPQLRIHNLICNYYKEIKFDQITNNEYKYFMNLLCHLNFPLRPQSLILSNEHINCLIQRFFCFTPTNIIQSIFDHLKNLTLIDCSQEDLQLMYLGEIDFSKIQHLHLTVQKTKQYQDKDLIEEDYISLNQFLVNKEMPLLETISIEFNNGLILSKSLTSYLTVQNVNLFLQTIDDLYILLDGLVPNVQTMTVHLIQPRLLTCDPPTRTSSYHQLTKFALLEHRIGLVVDDLKYVFGFMPNLNELTLSVRDTSDPIFCHGPSIESILNEYLPNLGKFDYTMTHRINEEDQEFIQCYCQWPMNIIFYENEDCKWVHIYSSPWPSNKNDQRRLPLVESGCYTTIDSTIERPQYIDHLLISKKNEFYDLEKIFCRTKKITTSLSIDIQLPLRISTIILTKKFAIDSIKSCVHPFVHHLIIQHRLIDEKELIDFAHQFPNIKYLEMLFPLKKSSYISCLTKLFSRNNQIGNYNYFPKLNHFSTDLCFELFKKFNTSEELFDWCIQNTDLKYHPYTFYVDLAVSTMSFWF